MHVMLLLIPSFKRLPREPSGYQGNLLVTKGTSGYQGTCYQGYLLATKGAFWLPGNLLVTKVFLSRVMRCQEGDNVPGLGTRTGSTLLFSTTVQVYDIKQRRNCSLIDCYKS